jgi:hypothetical protein
MARHYDSFVLRCWRLGNEQNRIEVQHLQTGASRRAVALSGALEWIEAQCDPMIPTPGEVTSTDRTALIDDRRMD